MAIAAHLLEAAPEDLQMEDSVISVVGTPTKSITMGEVAATCYQNSASLPAELDKTLEVVHRYQAPPTMWSNACHVVTCEVDPKTGIVKLLRYVVAEDCGRMINPNIVEGQSGRRRRPGHRRGVVRAQRVRRRRQPAGVDVPRLPHPDRGRDSRHRVHPHRDSRVDHRWLQGCGRRRRDRVRRRRCSTRWRTRSRCSAPR